MIRFRWPLYWERRLRSGEAGRIVKTGNETFSVHDRPLDASDFSGDSGEDCCHCEHVDRHLKAHAIKEGLAPLDIEDGDVALHRYLKRLD